MRLEWIICYPVYKTILCGRDNDLYNVMERFGYIMKGTLQRTANPPRLKRGKWLGALLSDTRAWLLFLPTAIVIYFFTIRPIAMGFWYSLHEMQGFTVKEFIGLENYQAILSDTQFPKVLMNTVLYVVWSFIIGFVPPIIIAIMINEMKHGSGWFKFSMYFPAIVPAVAATLLWYYMYLPDMTGLLNTILAKFGVSPQGWLQNSALTIPLITIMSAWKGFGATMLLYLAALQGVNQELYEAAVIDGAGFMKRIFRITLPQIRSIILLNVVRQIIGVFQIMTEPMTMTGGGPDGASMSIALWAYRTAFVEFNAGTSLAIGVITFFILIIFTMFYFYLERKAD